MFLKLALPAHQLSLLLVSLLGEGERRKPQVPERLAKKQKALIWIISSRFILASHYCNRLVHQTISILLSNSVNLINLFS
jgi:hypothetical protein